MAQQPPSLVTGNSPSTLSDEEKRATWRNIGYPGFSKWMVTSDDFMIFRRFQQLNIRVILKLQQDIIAREQELLLLDDAARKRPITDAHARSDSLQYDPCRERTKLMGTVKKDLRNTVCTKAACTQSSATNTILDDYLGSYLPIHQLPTAETHQVQQLKKWFYKNDGAIDVAGQSFIDTETDTELMALSAVNRLPLREFLDTKTSLFNNKFFSEKLSQGDTEAGLSSTAYQDGPKVDLFTTGLFMTLGLIFLFAPMWCLNFVANSVKRLSIITVFMLVFTIFLGFGTGAKPTEVLGATAA